MCARVRECARFRGFCGCSRVIHEFVFCTPFAISRCFASMCSALRVFTNSRIREFEKKNKKKVRGLREHSRIRFVFCSYHSIHELFSRPFASLFTNLRSRIHVVLAHPFAGIREAWPPHPPRSSRVRRGSSRTPFAGERLSRSYTDATRCRC